MSLSLGETSRALISCRYTRIQKLYTVSILEHILQKQYNVSILEHSLVNYSTYLVMSHMCVLDLQPHHARLVGLPEHSFQTPQLHSAVLTTTHHKIAPHPGN